MKVIGDISTEWVEAGIKVTRLTYREREILKLRWGIGYDLYTQEECGRIFKVTRERIRQVENKALAKIRNAVEPVEP